jgi:O-antigen/teichoic acid export membrane protein
MEQFRNHPLYRVHNIDTIMSSLWEFYKKKFVILFITSFVMSLGIQLISLNLDIAELRTITDPMAMLEKMKGLILPMLLMSLANLFFTAILQYYVIYSPVDSNVTIFSSIYKSLKYFLPYLVILILLSFFGSFAIMIGLLAIIIGVFFSLLYLMMIFMYILPTLMVEGNNIANAISRTIKLAHKGFWSNMGWVAVFLLILIVISVFSSAIVALPFTGSFLKMISDPEEAGNLINYMYNPVFIILTSLVNALTFPLMPIFATILYFNGIAKEEGARFAGPDSNEPPKVKVEDLYAKPLPEDNKEGN